MSDCVGKPDIKFGIVVKNPNDIFINIQIYKWLDHLEVFAEDTYGRNVKFEGEDLSTLLMKSLEWFANNLQTSLYHNGICVIEYLKDHVSFNRNYINYLMKGK